MEDMCGGDDMYTGSNFQPHDQIESPDHKKEDSSCKAASWT